MTEQPDQTGENEVILDDPLNMSPPEDTPDFDPTTDDDGADDDPDTEDDEPTTPPEDDADDPADPADSDEDDGPPVEAEPDDPPVALS